MQINSARLGSLGYSALAEFLYLSCKKSCCLTESNVNKSFLQVQTCQVLHVDERRLPGPLLPQLVLVQGKGIFPMYTIIRMIARKFSRRPFLVPSPPWALWPERPFADLSRRRRRRRDRQRRRRRRTTASTTTRISTAPSSTGRTRTTSKPPKSARHVALGQQLFNTN